jgi:hypothetical protein
MNCYNPGFYSSLNDEQGPNGDNFTTTHETCGYRKISFQYRQNYLNNHMVVHNSPLQYMLIYLKPDSYQIVKLYCPGVEVKSLTYKITLNSIFFIVFISKLCLKND